MRSAARDTDALPRVAVLMSTYNGTRFLEEQLASLAAQKGVRCELFVRDDGSTDATLAILARHADLWPQLAAPFTGPNLGPAMSFLRLLKSVPDDFDYYAFCDQDDVWLPDKLARAVWRLEDQEGPALYCSQVTCVDETLRTLGEPPQNGDSRFEHILFQNIAYGMTSVMNRPARSLISEHSPSGGVIMHDWWCALVVSALGRVTYDPQSGALYRQHGRNVLGAKSNRLADAVRQLKTLCRNPEKYYPIHAQGSEFLRLFGYSMTSTQRSTVERLVRSKRSFAARIGYALSEKFIRSGRFGHLAVRGLVLVGLY